MFAEKTQAEMIETTRLDATFYSPSHVQNAQIVRSNPGQSLEDCSTRILDHSFLSIRTEDYQDAGIPFVRVKNLKGIVLDEDFVFISEEANQRESQTICTPGDLLFAKTGKTAATPVPSHLSQVNTSQDVMVATLKNEIDAYYVASYLNSKHGSVYQERYVQGPVQPHLSLGSLRKLFVPLFRTDTQKFIGDKVRQAERLRAFASDNNRKLALSSTITEIEEALSFKETKSNRVPQQRLLSSRLDSKYYALKQEEVLRICLHHSNCSIADLNPTVSNGFEEREFVDAGMSYITVSELATGRLDLSSCPKISKGTAIPAKAKIDPNCVLVARSGSIGTAVKVHQRHSHAVISSHLIRLRFASEHEAIAVAAFLNSSAGNCLMWKISYGAVQSQIGQDELLALPIPNVVFFNQQHLLKCWNLREDSIEFAQSLSTCAKLFVEALIERKVMEDELIHAQKLLERGDDSADRAILARLYEGGWDATETQPLFPDLDAFYETLRMVEREQTEVAAK